MRIIGCDLHAAQQTIAMLDRDSGEVVERTVKHEGTAVRDFYAGLPPPIVVGIEATGSMGWFLQMMGDLGITCRVPSPSHDPITSASMICRRNSARRLRPFRPPTKFARSRKSNATTLRCAARVRR